MREVFDDSKWSIEHDNWNFTMFTQCSAQQHRYTACWEPLSSRGAHSTVPYCSSSLSLQSSKAVSTFDYRKANISRWQHSNEKLHSPSPRLRNMEIAGSMLLLSCVPTCNHHLGRRRSVANQPSTNDNQQPTKADDTEKLRKIQCH